MYSLWKLLPTDSMFLAPSSQDEADVVEEDEDITCSEPTQPASPTYEECWK